jgi:TldD protein
MNRSIFLRTVCLLLTFCGVSVAALFPASRPDILLGTMQSELKRATTSLAKSDPAPYYLSYAVADADGTTIAGANGSLIVSTRAHRRQADVMMRVGSPALDNTHGPSRASGITSGPMPLSDDTDAIARVLWRLTDTEYEQASAAFLRVRTNQAVQSEEEDKSPDFSEEAPQIRADESSRRTSFDQRLWEDRVRRVSAVFNKYPSVYMSLVVLEAGSNQTYLATSEGTTLVEPTAITRLVIEATTRASDGMDLLRVESFQALLPDQLPGESELTARAEKMAADLDALRNAPAAEPYAGPAMLSGRAAAVFFHEVLGHRLEGHGNGTKEKGKRSRRK